MDKLTIESAGVFKKYINGNLVQNINMNADYDGKKLVFDLDDNGNKIHQSLDNNTLIKLINQKISNKNLEDRLLEDFPLNKTKKNSGKKTKRKIYRKKKKTKKH